MRRVRNWDVALVQEMGPLRGEPLTWGETDCVSLCLRGIRAMYDDPPLPDELPTWTTKTGALRVLSREPAFHDVLLEHDAEPTKLTLAQSGDVLHGLPQDGQMPGYGLVAEGGVYHVDTALEEVVWHRLRDLRAAGLACEVVRPPHG